MPYFHAILNSLFKFNNPRRRATPLRVAQSLAPAITFGYLIPTSMLLAPTPNVGEIAHFCGRFHCFFLIRSSGYRGRAEKVEWRREG
jgi:hypothetical protein